MEIKRTVTRVINALIIAGILTVIFVLAFFLDVELSIHNMTISFAIMLVIATTAFGLMKAFLKPDGGYNR
jgi:uncharacterized membrane protein